VNIFAVDLVAQIHILEEYSSLLNKNCLSQSFIRFDAIKLLLMARSALNLYECAVSTSNADFRLYEFLKNSRVVRSISLNNKTVCLQTALVLMTS